MFDNTAILMIPGLPLWAEFTDFGDDFSQQFPAKITGMALGFFLNTLGLSAVIEALT